MISDITIPSNIDHIDWTKLGREIRRVRLLTSEQREIYFENVQRELPLESENLGNVMFDLIGDLYECRDFHRAVGLPYHDPKCDNGQIIRVAIMSFLGRVFSETRSSVF